MLWETTARTDLQPGYYPPLKTDGPGSDPMIQKRVILILMAALIGVTGIIGY